MEHRLRHLTRAAVGALVLTAGLAIAATPAQAGPTVPTDRELTAPSDRELALPSDRELSAPSDRELSAPSDRELSAPSDRELSAPSDRELGVPGDRELGVDAIRRNAGAAQRVAGAVAPGTSVDELTAQGFTCDRSLCFDAWPDEYYVGYRAVYIGSGYVYGHVDVWGVVNTKIPTSGNTRWWSWDWSEVTYRRGSQGQICARLWKYNGGSNYQDIGTTCSYV